MSNLSIGISPFHQRLQASSRMLLWLGLAMVILAPPP